MLWLIFTMTFSGGCAIHYYDPKTGAEHLWGIGHMVMRAAAPDEGHRAVVRGVDVLGLVFRYLDDRISLSVGWEKQRRLEIIDADTAIRLEWPTSDLLSIRVGSDWPRSLKESDSANQEEDQ